VRRGEDGRRCGGVWCEMRAIGFPAPFFLLLFRFVFPRSRDQGAECGDEEDGWAGCRSLGYSNKFYNVHL
jgi:hypothetical protein